MPPSGAISRSLTASLSVFFGRAWRPAKILGRGAYRRSFDFRAAQAARVQEVEVNPVILDAKGCTIADALLTVAPR